MGECNCSKFTIMQLFHELKQQFPTLPDHVVSQCIAQNNHDLESCARSLRDTQESRPPPGAFPPPPPDPLMFSTSEHHTPKKSLNYNHCFHRDFRQPCARVPSTHRFIVGERQVPASFRAHRPASLDMNSERMGDEQIVSGNSISSVPATSSNRAFFDDRFKPVDQTGNTGFQLSVNVACGPYGDHVDVLDLDSANEEGQSTLVLTEQPTRNITTVSLNLRPSTSIDLVPRHQAKPSLAYSTPPLDSGRSYQSSLQISIGKSKPPQVPQRPTSLVTNVYNSNVSTNRPAGLSLSVSNHLPRLTTSVSAPSTPLGPPKSIKVTTSSLPVTPMDDLPSNFQNELYISDDVLDSDTSGPSDDENLNYREEPPTFELEAVVEITERENDPRVQEVINDDSPIILSADDLALLNEVPEDERPILKQQLFKNERLARAIEREEVNLDELKQEVREISTPDEEEVALKNLERDLRSQVYMLQVECDRLTEEVDRRSDFQAPLGETSKEFYRSIYTGQSFNSQSANSVPPPLPSQPPALEPEPEPSATQEEDEDGPPWVCPKCTFNNHPLMSHCEECETPRVIETGPVSSLGATQDIRIRVTRHNKFSPRRTLYNWVL